MDYEHTGQSTPRRSGPVTPDELPPFRNRRLSVIDIHRWKYFVKHNKIITNFSRCVLIRFVSFRFNRDNPAYLSLIRSQSTEWPLSQ